MGTHHDSPNCEMCDGTNTYSSFESRSNHYEVECYDCGYGMIDSPLDKKYEATMITTRHCDCGHGINFFTVVDEGYSFECSECNTEEVHPTIEMFRGVKPADRWDMLHDEVDWQPCSNECGDYWYDQSSDAEKCCHNCLKLLEVNDIWQDLGLNL